MTVRDIDRGAKALLRRLAKKAKVKVGVIGSKAAETHRKSGDLTVVQIATKHEYGIGAPRRSFIRDYVDENETTLRDYERKAGRRVLRDGKDVRQVLTEMGHEIEGQIKIRIVNHIPPKLSKATEQSKGSDTPLVDTGQLISSIVSVVE